ncbi:MAG: magnesium transporter [Deltaproteobacteria bacterium]|nr:magnesium transporter [Deltaproteobacteria bacterium]
MPGHIDIKLLRKAIRTGPGGVGKRMLARLGPAGLAQLFAELPPAELKRTVELLSEDPGRLALALRQIPDELLHEFTLTLGDANLARLLERLEPDDAKRLVLGAPEEAHEQILALMEPRAGAQIRHLLRYSPESAGGRMNPHFIGVDDDVLVGEAIRKVRTARPEVPLFYVYVLDSLQQLAGVLSLSQLVRASDDTPVSTLMVREVVSVEPDADQEEVARLVSRRGLLAIPVVHDQRLLGLVTIDDVIDVVEQEATEDMYNMAGLSEGDRVFSPPHRSLTKRLPWNMLNLATALLAASVVSLFEDTIGKLVVLATFMPVVASIGGNTGNQTLTVILRGITLGELEFSSAWRAILKELTPWPWSPT